jgi:hypothetical protein
VAVHNNEKQGWIVIFAFLGLLLVVVIWGAVSSARNDLAYALASVKKSMEMSYQNVFSNKSDLVQGDSLANSGELMSAFCDAKAGHLKFSGYIPPEMTWISSEAVKLKSTNLLCVVELGGESRYGMDAKGECRFVSGEEFANWPRVSAQKTGEAAGKMP